MNLRRYGSFEEKKKMRVLFSLDMNK